MSSIQVKIQPQQYADTGQTDSANEPDQWILDTAGRELLEEIIATATSSTGSTTTVSTTDAPIDYRLVITRLLKRYPLISVDGDVLGEPRIANSRLAVSIVLSALTELGSFEEVIKGYENNYTEEELKEAVKFARDFLDSFYARRGKHPDNAR